MNFNVVVYSVQEVVRPCVTISAVILVFDIAYTLKKIGVLPNLSLGKEPFGVPVRNFGTKKWFGILRTEPKKVFSLDTQVR